MEQEQLASKHTDVCNSTPANDSARCHYATENNHFTVAPELQASSLQSNRVVNENSIETTSLSIYAKEDMFGGQMHLHPHWQSYLHVILSASDAHTVSKQLQPNVTDTPLWV